MWTGKVEHPILSSEIIKDMKGMAKNQKSYTPEFKQQTVYLYNSGGTSYLQLEYGVNRSTISGWVKQLSPIRVSEDETVTLKEYKALQKEIQRLKIGNEILKKRPPYPQKNNSRNSGICYGPVQPQNHWVCLWDIYDSRTGSESGRDKKGIILHSGLRSQYTGLVFEDYLSRKGIQHSFSRKGNPYDNACIESFHSVLKKEEIYLHTYQDTKEARRAIFEYIEGWYNRKRIHSAIGYITPQKKEDEELKKSA